MTVDYSQDSFLSVLDRFCRANVTTKPQVFGIAIVRPDQQRDPVDVVFFNEATRHPGNKIHLSRMWKTIPGQPDWEAFEKQIRSSL